MAQICCPSCNRDYELPRRYMIRHEDFDFMPIPRIMPCLHTACHSCLVDQFQRSKIGKITCPICRNDEVIKGVKYLPLDIANMKQVLEVKSTEVMSHCARCYEKSASFSWCRTCSSALCEFHHQDHKLSVDTSKHDVLTFKEIAHQHVNVEFKFTPVPCPEVLLKDCSLYCHTCLHLVSAQAMIEGHKDHEVTNYLDSVPEMKEAVQDSKAAAKAKHKQTKDKIDFMQKCLEAIDESEDRCVANVALQFGALKKLIKRRESEVLDKLSRVVEEKRKVLVNQLSALTESLEDCENAFKVAGDLLSSTQKDDVELMYLVNAAETVESRTDLLSERADRRLQDLKFTPADFGVEFVQEELLLANSILRSLGGVRYSSEAMTFDEYAAYSARGESSPNKSAANESTEPRQLSTQASTSSLVPRIVFSVKLGTESSAGGKGGLRSRQQVVIEARSINEELAREFELLQQGDAEARIAVVPDAAVGSVAGVAEVAKEAVEEYKSTEQPAIDATVAATTPEDGQTVAAAAEEGATDAVTVQLEGSAGAAIQSNAETSMEQQQSAEAAHTSVNGNNNKSSSSEENRHQGGGGDDADTASSSVLRQPHGVLLGKIILDTDPTLTQTFTATLQIDRRLLSKHELHCYFESMLDSGKVPLMRVTKEFVPVS